MRKHLYFVCPTDHLEIVIENNTKQENYFVTSLGNSVNFNLEFIEEINTLIDTKQITEITFILSNNNKMITDALESQCFDTVKGLKHFYDIIAKQKKDVGEVWQTVAIPVISYCLNLKIKELQMWLTNWLYDGINVNAQIYNRQKNTFNEIHSDVFYREHFSLN